MKRFSYLFSVEPVDVPDAPRLLLSTLFKRGRVKPSISAILVKTGFVTSESLIPEHLDNGALQHLLDTNNPWRSSPSSCSIMKATHWADRHLFACSLFGLTEKRALSIHEALRGYDAYIGIYPQTASAACEHILERSLIPIVAFQKSATATSGARELEEVKALGLSQITYMDPELFFVRDELRSWAGLPPEGDSGKLLFP